MPLYDFKCRACSHQFEGLVRPSERVACPACGSGDLEQLQSAFAVSSEGTRQASFAGARQRFKNSKDRKDKGVAEYEAVQKHLQDH
jgi:putative FmdB family regulatory protein